MTIACPHCTQHLEADESYGGQEVQCPACQGALVVPLGQVGTRPTSRAPLSACRASAPATSSRWGVACLWLGLVLVGLGLVWFWQRKSNPERILEKSIGKSVVIDTSGAADACVQTPAEASPVARIRVQNPPQAITFVLELKKPVQELFEHSKAFTYGVAKIYFDTDDNPQTGSRETELASTKGFEAILEARLEAAAQVGRIRVTGGWDNARSTLRNAKEHRIECSVFRVDARGREFDADRSVRYLARGKCEGNHMWLTVSYRDLAAVSGQTVRVTIRDDGAAETYSAGEVLPSFTLKLR